MRRGTISMAITFIETRRNSVKYRWSYNKGELLSERQKHETENAIKIFGKALEGKCQVVPC